MQNAEDNVTTVVDDNSERKEFNPVKGTKGYVYMKSTEQVLNIAMATERNVVLFGKGGFGKSEYTIDYLAERGINPYVITMGTGMTTDRLFGGLNLPTFNEHGKIEYLVENSFMNHEHVIFEELFDAPDFILEQLKDILSSGWFRNGSQTFEIKTKLIICCTNKTREEFAKNTSLKALMERFPLENEVKWPEYNKITYENLLNTKLGYADPMLTYILEQYAIAQHTISPRIALVAADTIERCGPECLSFIADFNAKPSILTTAIARFKGVIEMTNLMKSMSSKVDQFAKLNLGDNADIKKGEEINRALFAEITKLKSIKVDDASIAESTANIKKFTDVYNNNKKQLELLVHLAGE